MSVEYHNEVRTGDIILWCACRLRKLERMYDDVWRVVNDKKLIDWDARVAYPKTKPYVQVWMAGDCISLMDGEIFMWGMDGVTLDMPSSVNPNCKGWCFLILLNVTALNLPRLFVHECLHTFGLEEREVRDLEPAVCEHLGHRWLSQVNRELSKAFLAIYKESMTAAPRIHEKCKEVLEDEGGLWLG